MPSRNDHVLVLIDRLSPGQRQQAKRLAAESKALRREMAGILQRARRS